MEFNFNTSHIFEDARVRLEPLTHDHLEPLLPIAQQEPDLLKYSPSSFGSKASLIEYIDKAVKERQGFRRYAFAIYDKEKMKYAGSSSLGDISNEHRRLQIGWTWIGREFQRTGLNRHSKRLLLEFVFEVLEFERVEFLTDARNLQSQMAIEAIGGVFEGELRNHTKMPDGFRRNTRIYSILRKEWEVL